MRDRCITLICGHWLELQGFARGATTTGGPRNALVGQLLKLQPNGGWCRYAHTGSSRAAQGSEARLDMVVLNDLDRLHLVIDTADRLPHAGDKGIYLTRQL